MNLSVASEETRCISFPRFPKEPGKLHFAPSFFLSTLKHPLQSGWETNLSVSFADSSPCKGEPLGNFTPQWTTGTCQLRQKKPTAFRFRGLRKSRGNSSSVGSFFLSKSNPPRSRRRLCRPTDAACPLRVLRWASIWWDSKATGPYSAMDSRDMSIT